MSDHGTPGEAEPPESAGQIIMQPEQMAGVWANWARVSHSEYEFTLDFVRLDFANTPPERDRRCPRVRLAAVHLPAHRCATVELGPVREEGPSPGGV